MAHQQLCIDSREKWQRRSTQPIICKGLEDYLKYILMNANMVLFTIHSSSLLLWNPSSFWSHVSVTFRRRQEIHRTVSCHVLDGKHFANLRTKYITLLYRAPDIISCNHLSSVLSKESAIKNLYPESVTFQMSCFIFNYELLLQKICNERGSDIEYFC